MDEEAAEIVKRIFKMASEGYGYNKITRELQGTPNSITYFMLNNPDYFKNPRWGHSYTWNNKSINVILNNEVYLGKLIYGKTRTVTVGGKKASRRPEEEWIKVEGTHEPIISQELWDKAHTVLAIRKRETKDDKKPHIFAGLIKCKDCGRALLYDNKKLSENNRGSYKCSKYSREGKEQCTSHYITYKKVYDAVYNSINELAKSACKNEDKFIKRLEEESQLLLSSTLKKSSRECEHIKKRMSELDRFIKKLFENSVHEVMSPERVKSMLTGYEKEETELKERLQALEQQRQEQEKLMAQVDSFTELIKKVREIKVLEASIFYQLISRIEIGQAQKNAESGGTEQQIKIYYRFSPLTQNLSI